MPVNKIKGPVAAPCLSGLLAVLLSIAVAAAASAQPRISPLPESEWTEEHRAIVASIPGRLTNAVATYLHDPELARTVVAFERYLSEESTLPARDRELAILRTAWLGRSDYVWAHRAEPARRAGLTEEQFARIAQGGDAPGWSPFEAALLRAVDELHVDTFIADDTYTVLADRYTPEQLMDLVFTVGHFTRIAGTANSLRIEIEPGLDARRPYGIPFTTSAKWTNQRLMDKGARLPPLERSEWSPELRALLDPNDTGNDPAIVYRVYAHSYGMEVPRRAVSSHVRSGVHTTWQLETLLLRISARARAEYIWGVHSAVGRRIGMDDADFERIVAGPAHPGGDPLDRALVRSVDEFFRDTMVSDETWAVLADAFGPAGQIHVLTTIGVYRMFAMAMNSFGIQLDENFRQSRFPPELR